MKYIFTLLTFLILSTTAFAQSIYWDNNYFQQCNGNTNSILPSTGNVPGFYPADSTQPSAIRGETVTDTIYFKNYSSTSGGTVPLISVRLDSIYLPAGLCWSTNKSNNTFSAGENGVIFIYGNTLSPTGQYKLRVIATWTITGGTSFRADIETFTRQRYYLRVTCNSNAHPAISYTDTVSAFIPNTVCPLPSAASIYAPSGSSYCPGDTAAMPLTTISGTGYRYRWSTGDTTSYLWPHTSGTYSVTVYLGADSLIAPAVNITVVAPQAAFQLTPDLSSPHTWTVLNQCTVLQGDSSYIWYWGDNTTSIGATPSHTYADSGYYTICVTVTNLLGCKASYCDSNVYLFKTQNQMVTMNVVQYPLGVEPIGQNLPDVKCYAGAIHFSQPVSTPSDITLYDMSGRAVLTFTHWTGTSLSTSAMADGIYLLALQNNMTSLSRKVITSH